MNTKRRLFSILIFIVMVLSMQPLTARADSVQTSVSDIRATSSDMESIPVYEGSHVIADYTYVNTYSPEIIIDESPMLVFYDSYAFDIGVNYKDTAIQAPKNEDNMSWILVALLFISGFGAIVTIIIRKKLQIDNDD